MVGYVVERRCKGAEAWEVMGIKWDTREGAEGQAEDLWAGEQEDCEYRIARVSY